MAAAKTFDNKYDRETDSRVLFFKRINIVSNVEAASRISLLAS